LASAIASAGSLTVKSPWVMMPSSTFSVTKVRL
jgi:hypothetical protein